MARKRLPECQEFFSSYEAMLNNTPSGDQRSLFDESDDPYPPRVNVSGTEVRAKEVILVVLALLVLVFSVCHFFKHWKKNYFDINQIPYYSYLYKKDSNGYPVCDPAPVTQPLIHPCGCDRSNVESLWQAATSQVSTGKTPSAMAAFTAAAAVAVLADSATNSRTLTRTVSKKSLGSIHSSGIPTSKHPRLCKVATRIDLLRSASKASSSSETGSQELISRIPPVSSHPARFRAPSRAQSDLSTRFQQIYGPRPIRQNLNHLENFRRMDSSSALLLFSSQKKVAAKKAFGDLSTRMDLTERVNRLEAVPDMTEEEESSSPNFHTALFIDNEKVPNSSERRSSTSTFDVKVIPKDTIVKSSSAGTSTQLTAVKTGSIVTTV